MKNALSLGTFDGVHKGHRAVLDLPQDTNKIAVTFLKPPKAVITGESLLLMTTEDKSRILKKIGINEIFYLDFSEVKDMSAREFLELLYKKYKPSFISCGFNYHFGKNGEGNVAILKQFCNENSIELRCCEPITHEGVAVSSTSIREMLRQGKLEKANELLAEPFSFEAKVISGDKRGRTIGFPTINQKYPEQLVPLKFGVYKTKVEFEGGKYEGITNIGIRPTFKNDYIISETYIKNFSGDLYEKNIRITPLKFLREEVKFSSLEALKSQIEADLNS